MQSRPKRGEADQHARLDAAVLHTFMKKNRQRAGGRVAVPFDVMRHFFRWQLESLRYRFEHFLIVEIKHADRHFREARRLSRP